MSCSCKELESKYADADCKCTRYREEFPECQCEEESVSSHSPGLVGDDEVLVRTLFTEQAVGRDGRPKPLYFRSDASKGGFSVDRMCHTDVDGLIFNKKRDPRYKGYLRFVAAVSNVVRRLRHEDGRRLFCVYDSATKENGSHADICQNVYFKSGAFNRKQRMMEIAWQLRDAFGEAQRVPPTSLVCKTRGAKP